jgi:hypothetical protein
VDSIYPVEESDEKILAIYLGLRDICMLGHSCVQFRSILSVLNYWIEYAAQRFSSAARIIFQSSYSRLSVISQYVIRPDLLLPQKAILPVTPTWLPVDKFLSYRLFDC